MKPTNRLRWIEAYHNCMDGPIASSVEYWPENGPKHFKLQQWWEDESGEGKWQDVEVGNE